ncbi:MAG: hypothetical protein GY711_28100 [bacterium]|nr:hypothetical protein [bacterium]
MLFRFIFQVVDLSAIPEPAWVVRTVLHWFLVAWLAVALVAGYAARAVVNDTPERARLRLRSLRLVAAWLVFLGLGLRLAEQVALRGTLHAWVAMAFEVLAIPIGIVLVLIWRPEVFRRLEEESRDSALATKLLGTRQGRPPSCSSSRVPGPTAA